MHARNTHRQAAYCSCLHACHRGSAKKQMRLSSPSGGEAEPSPPWQVCSGCAFTQPPPPRFGMEPASPGRLFVPRLCLRQRAGCLRTSPQNPVSPARWCLSPRPRRRQSLHHRSPSTVWGGPAIRRRGAQRKHVGSCIKVYASPMGMKREWKKSVPKGAILKGK